ncbi:MAG: carbamoyltransferase [Candidatus Nitrohelix vancouverensis]|uniref:Carbamoyltransferase n=1 Tax=Candidatus Nitrohelix vancouverensis TaxID=2705534 RepID=A0A7T0C2E7_9BACT|nr:MAG: carbamoyltransferase [Candidatus Nitrohelix vancouverensis]
MYILGISAFYHDSAAALICDGEIIAAAQEERFSRIKHDPNFPKNSIAYCLSQAAISSEAVDFIVFYDKPFLKFERLLETYLQFAPKGFSSFCKAIPVWLKEKLFQKKILCDNLKRSGFSGDLQEKLLFSEHHLSHAASAFYPSPFEEAAVLTMDGVGEWTTTSLSIGKEHSLSILKEIHFPHSLGLLYSAFTYYAGFKVNSGEYKLMGLAPYGRPEYADTIKDHLIDVKADGSFRLNLEYFDYCVGSRMTNDKFDRLFDGPPRPAEQEITQKDMDIAASIQTVLEEVVIKLTESIARETRTQNLCLAGGVALNCVANGKILRNANFKNIWIQPSSGDAGGALGAALVAYHLFKGQARKVHPSQDSMKGSYLGNEFSNDEIQSRLQKEGAVFEQMTDDALINTCVQTLNGGAALGWFQGRMEFGPRALGARSILGDARSPGMQSILNIKVKFRESFRPFAPSILREDLADWFDLDTDSPYMLLVADVVKSRRLEMSPEEERLFGIEKLHVPRSEIPAVTHVDYSARIQTVHKETNAKYHRLISEFKATTGCPVLVNTSFNVRGEPIVCTPEDAFRCFMGTDIEALAIGNCFLKKKNQAPELKKNYEGTFAPD